MAAADSLSAVTAAASRMTATWASMTTPLLSSTTGLRHLNRTALAGDAGHVIGGTDMPEGTQTESAVLEGLLADAAGGDQRALAELLERYWPFIRTIVHRRKQAMGAALGWREQTEDLEQDVALRLLRELPKHEWRGGGALRAWIAKLVSAEVVDVNRYHRAKKRDRAAETGLEAADAVPLRTRSPETKADDHERAAQLKQALATMKPKYSEAVILHQMGYSQAEAGDILGCTEEAARKLTARGLSQLQRLLYSSSSSSSAPSGSHR
jgi:RNA polymerase sigma factor (sigma-70 family)